MANKPVTPADDHSLTTSPTEAGPTKPNKAEKAAHVDAINQVFALFRVNYHNQYYAAFNDTQLLNQTKKLWLESLARFSPEQILRGAKIAIESAEYLPTLHKMIVFCNGDPAKHGLPQVHQAYVEACNARNPKNQNDWSHLAVYHAGREAGWYFLATTPEYVALPIFKQHYQNWCDKVVQGETLPTIDVPLLPSETTTPLSKDENKQRLNDLRKTLKI